MTISPLAEMRTVSMRLTVPVVLAATVLLATALHAVLAASSPSPWIVPDELIYSELAKSIAAGGLPAIRDEVSFAYGIGYPALLAPVWAVFNDVTTAYAVAKALNALILSLTAVPAYFLARRFVAEAPALIVAALSVAVPSMLYAGTLMTEVALYPAFVLALLGMSVALERPTLATQAGALGAIALASAIKMLAVVLVLAYVAGIVLYHWLNKREDETWPGRLNDYAPTWTILAGVVITGLTTGVVLGQSPLSLLGAYAVILGNIDVLTVPWWALLHLAEFDLYVAVIPFAATALVVLTGCRRGATRQSRLFASLVMPATAVLLFTVAAYASPPHGGAEGYLSSVARLHERATFVLAPLFLIGLMAWLGQRTLSSRAAVRAACVASAALPGAIPADQLGGNVTFQTLALVPWASFDVRWPLGVLVFASVLALVTFLGATSRVRAVSVVTVVATVFVSVSAVVHSSMVSASNWTRTHASGTTPDWIDRTARDAPVSVLWAEMEGVSFVDPAPRHRIVWLGEFFNRSVGPVYELGTSMPYNLPATRVHLRDGYVVLEDGGLAPLGELVLIPCHVRVASMPIARDPSTGAAVVRVRGPVRAEVLEPGSCPGENAS